MYLYVKKKREKMENRASIFNSVLPTLANLDLVSHSVKISVIFHYQDFT